MRAPVSALTTHHSRDRSRPTLLDAYGLFSLLAMAVMLIAPGAALLF